MRDDKDTMADGRDNYNAHDFLQVKSFLANSWVEVPDRTSASRVLRSRFVMRGAVSGTDHHTSESERKAVPNNIPESSKQGTKEQEETEEKDDGEEDKRLDGKGGRHNENAEQMKKRQRDAGESIIASAAYASNPFPSSITAMN